MSSQIGNVNNNNGTAVPVVPQNPSTIATNNTDKLIETVESMKKQLDNFTTILSRLSSRVDLLSNRVEQLETRNNLSQAGFVIPSASSAEPPLNPNFLTRRRMQQSLGNGTVTFETSRASTPSLENELRTCGGR